MTTTLPPAAAGQVLRRSPENPPPAVTHPSWCLGTESWCEYDGIYHRSGDDPITVADVDGKPVQLVIGIDRLDEEPDQPGETTIYLGDEEYNNGLSMTLPQAVAVAEALLGQVARVVRRDPAEQHVPAADIRLGDQIWTSTEYADEDGEDSRTGWHTVCTVIAQPGEVEVIAHLDPDSCDWDDGLKYRPSQMVLVRRRSNVLDPGCDRQQTGRPGAVVR